MISIKIYKKAIIKRYNFPKEYKLIVLKISFDTTLNGRSKKTKFILKLNRLRTGKLFLKTYNSKQKKIFCKNNIIQKNEDRQFKQPSIVNYW